MMAEVCENCKNAEYRNRKGNYELFCEIKAGFVPTLSACKDFQKEEME